jgi:hypothetical protein
MIVIPDPGRVLLAVRGQRRSMIATGWYRTSWRLLASALRFVGVLAASELVEVAGTSMVERSAACPMRSSCASSRCTSVLRGGPFVKMRETRGVPAIGTIHGLHGESGECDRRHRGVDVGRDVGDHVDGGWAAIASSGNEGMLPRSSPEESSVAGLTLLVTKPLAERAAGQEADPKFGENGDDVSFVVAPPRAIDAVCDDS